MASHARPVDWTIHVSGGVLVPGIASTISQSKSISGWRSRMASICAPNCRRTSTEASAG